MGTKNNPGPFDCYAAADPDEPIFVLLGRDKHAPALVWLWANLRELGDEDPEKVTEARQCVDQMIVWQHAHGRQAEGVAVAALAGIFELIRAANTAVDLIRKGEVPVNRNTDVDLLRAFLCEARPAPAEEN